MFYLFITGVVLFGVGIMYLFTLKPDINKTTNLSLARRAYAVMGVAWTIIGLTQITRGVWGQMLQGSISLALAITNVVFAVTLLFGAFFLLKSMRKSK